MTIKFYNKDSSQSIEIIPKYSDKTVYIAAIDEETYTQLTSNGNVDS